MKQRETADQIFQAGSTTYYYSSLFFPPQLRDKVTILYAFVRTVDDLVDSVPQKKADFYTLKKVFYDVGRKGMKTNNQTVDAFLELERSFDFDVQWADAFWYAMELDLTKHTYKNEAELIEYMHGSAEVIGLMMAKLMSLHEESFSTAQMLGRAMQYINFLRDLQEDNDMGRTYISQKILKKYKIPDLKEKTAKAYKARFSSLMRSQIAQYYEWQHQAEKGFKYLPGRARIAIKTASDLYGWTAEKIAENPMIVFEKKVKPSKLQVILFGLTNTLRVLIHES